MDASQLHWKYNNKYNVVENFGAKGRELAVIIPDTLPPQYGPFIARAPELQVLAKHLFGVLERSNTAWNGEEKSVKREHRSFIDGANESEKFARLFVEGRAQHPQLKKLSEMEVPGLARKEEVPINWRYDCADHTIRNTAEREIGIIRGDTSKEQSALGAMVVAAPANFKIAHFLLAKIEDSHAEWMGEESSITSEHENLIMEMHATVLRAKFLLTGEVSKQFSRLDAVISTGMFIEQDSDYAEGCYRVNLNVPLSGIAMSYGEFAADRSDAPYNSRGEALNAALRVIQRHNAPAIEQQEEIEQEAEAPTP